MTRKLAQPIVAWLTLAAAVTFSGEVHANLLANAGFETTAFTASSNVLGNFVGNQGTLGIRGRGASWPAASRPQPLA